MVFEAGQKFTTDLESSTPLLATSLLAMPPKLTYSSKPSSLAVTGIAQHEPNPELPPGDGRHAICLHGCNVYW